MKIVLYKPNTSSKRHYINIVNNFLIKKPVLKTKLFSKKKYQVEIIKVVLQYLIVVHLIKKNIEK